MLSGKFESVSLASLVVNPDRRQRDAVTEEAIETLAADIEQKGLMHPIVVDRDTYEIIAGETRFHACMSLGWTRINVHWVQDCDEAQLQEIQLSENLKRTNLTWQEEAAAIAELHTLYSTTREDWGLNDTAHELKISPQKTSEYRKVGAALAAGDERIKTASAFSVARGILQREAARAATGELQLLGSAPVSAPSEAPTLSKVAAEEVVGGVSERGPLPFLNADFNLWQMEYTGPKFNLLHCDFPYGIDTDKHDSSAQGYENYDDSLDTYRTLLSTLLRGMQNVVDDSAHMVFWYSKKFHHMTRTALEEMGWEVAEYELVWCKSDRSILARPNHDYRRGTEQAFFCTRGARPIVRATVNFHVSPATKDIHKSEKPREMLTHFLRPLVDKSTRMLDPTMGSGNAVRVAEELGASEVLGLEKLSQVFEDACRAYEAARHG